MSDLAVYYSVRNNEIVWLKNMPLKLMFKYFILKIVMDFGACINYCVLRGKWRAFMKGYLDFIFMIPLLIKKRKEDQRLKRVNDEYIDSLLSSPWEGSNLLRKKRHLLGQ